MLAGTWLPPSTGFMLAVFFASWDLGFWRFLVWACGVLSSHPGPVVGDLAVVGLPLVFLAWPGLDLSWFYFELVLREINFYPSFKKKN